jgi:hypothetical protein
MSTRVEAPTAQVLRIASGIATVSCPYCGHNHTHPVDRRGYQRRAPGCGMIRTQAERLAGYRFQT